MQKLEKEDSGNAREGEAIVRGARTVGEKWQKREQKKREEEKQEWEKRLGNQIREEQEERARNVKPGATQQLQHAEGNALADEGDKLESIINTAQIPLCDFVHPFISELDY